MQNAARTGTVDYLLALRRLKQWTRERFGLPDGTTILVNESPTEEIGFPPVVTLTSFWSKPHIRHEFRVFRPIEEIVEDDLPPGWMKDVLVADDNILCSCC